VKPTRAQLLGSLLIALIVFAVLLARYVRLF